MSSRFEDFSSELARRSLSPVALLASWPHSVSKAVPSGGNKDLPEDAAAQVAQLQEEVARWRQEAADRLRPQAFPLASEVHQDDGHDDYPEAPQVPEDAENASLDNESPLHPDLHKVSFDPRFKASKLHKYSRGFDPGEFSRSYALAIEANGGVRNTMAKCFPLALEGVALRWFWSLKPGSIKSLEQLKRKFVSNF
ncbi:hypothetical protein GUJ93_ZPchr0004g38901 [Zizania palustris]|uniref:Retrotransposon gag domain-containing protein n=1 Tax=Zizania palustris TaxID=103762 RepID=A0A8J5T0A4_ZIZPA|nr:hypothetical protein GUJ93_ZPchr0004g38901 [Zizania palustris]